MNKIFRNITYIIAIASIVSSCSSINQTHDTSKVISTKDYSRGEYQTITIDEGKKKDAKKKKKKEDKNKKNKSKNTNKEFSSNSNNTSLTLDNLQGEWTLYSKFNTIITEDERPFIIFEKDNLEELKADKNIAPSNKFYANDGCNTINADFVINQENTLITFTNALKTQRYCTAEDAPYEYDINGAFSRAKKHTITMNGNEIFLNFIDEHGVTMLTFSKINLNFLDGIWKITKINGDGSKCKHKEYTITIDIYERNVFANLPCNTVNGKILIDVNDKNSITFLDLAATRATCKEIATEQEILLALESTTNYELDGDKKVILSDKNGKSLLELSFVSDKYMKDR